MDEVKSFLENEIRETRQVIEAAHSKLVILEGLLRKHRPSLVKLIQPEVPAFSGGAVLESVEDSSKTQLVLDTVIAHEAQGIKAGKIYEELIAKGISIKKNYVYSILNRQKEKGLISNRKGKYYPTVDIYSRGEIQKDAEKVSTSELQ